MEDLYRSQFRLPYHLYELLKAAAHQEGRSVNAEVVARLQQSFESKSAGENVTRAEVSAMLAAFRTEVEAMLRDVKQPGAEEGAKGDVKRVGKSRNA